MENIWLYTLSTLAQVMSSVVALFGVFVVFKLDRVHKEISKIRESLIPFCIHIFQNNYHFLGNQELVKKYKLQKEQAAYGLFSDEEMRNILKDALSKKGQDGYTFRFQQGNCFVGEETCKHFSFLIRLKIDILRKLKNSIVLCIASIVFSLLFLGTPFSFENWTRFEYNCYLLLPLVLFSIVGLVYVGCSIWGISKE